MIVLEGTPPSESIRRAPDEFIFHVLLWQVGGRRNKTPNKRVVIIPGTFYLKKIRNSAV
jgi:hypothetical protein